ncbi:MAG: hypothetical protein ACR2NZ_14465 [Rubripirellula sp.]
MSHDNSLQQKYEEQQFPNGYELVDGVAMHAENGDRFQIPPDIIKKYVSIGQFVELRIDSPRFSVHEDSTEKCYCESCLGEASKPILRHEHPSSLVGEPKQAVPSRGWGEDFWVRVTSRDGHHFEGTIDNPLYEARLHGLNEGDDILFHANHLLALHDIHRRELVLTMDPDDLKTLAKWLGSQYE